MKKKKLTGKLSLDKSRISALESSRITGGCITNGCLPASLQGGCGTTGPAPSGAGPCNKK